jgi:PPOX class probable F420-dependent enzyme
MSLDPDALPADTLTYLRERHLGTLTTLRPDGSPHVTPIGFMFDPVDRTVRVITRASSVKVRHIAAGRTRVSVCQVDGGRWITLEGEAIVTSDPAAVRRAVDAYSSRYRVPGERNDRVAIEFRVDRVLGRI